jgi:hypothetical protein
MSAIGHRDHSPDLRIEFGVRRLRLHDLAIVWHKDYPDRSPIDQDSLPDLDPRSRSAISSNFVRTSNFVRSPIDSDFVLDPEFCELSEPEPQLGLDDV